MVGEPLDHLEDLEQVGLAPAVAPGDAQPEDPRAHEGGGQVIREAAEALGLERPSVGLASKRLDGAQHGRQVSRRPHVRTHSTGRPAPGWRRASPDVRT